MRGLHTLVGIDPEDAMLIAQHQMERIAEQGGVDAAIKDLEAHYKRPLTDDERSIVGQAMTLGVCVSYCVLGQSLLQVENDMRKKGIDPEALARQFKEATEDGALRSEGDEHEAERMTHELIGRVRKPNLH